jgi:opacity protein-like surface antigen
VHITLLCCLAACIVPLASQAQDIAPTTYRPFYVGVGANLGSYYLRWGGGYIREPFSFSPALAVGIAIKPSWALQARVTAYEQSRRSNYSYVGSSLEPRKGKTTYVTSTYRNRIVVVPLLLRPTLTRDVTRRLQVDVLLGITLISTRTRTSGISKDSVDTVLLSSSENSSALNKPLTFGAGLRYKLTANVELATEVLSSLHTTFLGFHPNANMQLELRYRFGPLKKS